MDAHDTHCCIEHGCKYGDEDCPIENAVRKQQCFCESCGLETEGYYGKPERSRSQQQHYLDVLWEESQKPKGQAFCLVCDKELKLEQHTGNVIDGGPMLVSFHYGSRHDQMGSKSEYYQETPLDKLLACDEIEAFICDDCFERKVEKMKGYEIEKTRKRIRKFGV
jgi:hypothetical protein